MINTFAQIDYLASAGRTTWHRASAVTKLALAALVVLLAVFTPSWASLVAMLVTAFALALSARLPLRLIGAAAAAPLLFIAVFLVAHLRQDWSANAALAMRPMIAGLAALWLVGTTPYPDLFAPISRLVPRTVGDSLFLTYRAVFALLARTELVWRALTLRGAAAGPVRRRVRLMGEAVGTVVLSGFDRSQRLYQVMQLRGHSGRICGCRHYLDWSAEDLWVVAVGAWVVAASLLLWHVRSA